MRAASMLWPYAKVYAIVGRISRRHRGHICGPNFGAPKRRLQVRDHVPLQALHFGRFRVAYPCPLLPYFCLLRGLRDRRRRPEISKTARYRKTCICVVCAFAFAVVLDAWRMRWASHENIGGKTNTRDTEQIPQLSRRADLRRNRYPVPWKKRTAGAAKSAPVPQTNSAAFFGASVSAATLSCDAPNSPESSRMTGGGRHHTVVAHDSRTSALTNAPKWRSRSLSALRVLLWRRRAKGLAGQELAERKGEWRRGRQDRRRPVGAVVADAPDGLLCQDVGFVPTWLVSPTLSYSPCFFLLFQQEACSAHDCASTFQA